MRGSLILGLILCAGLAISFAAGRLIPNPDVAVFVAFVCGAISCFLAFLREIMALRSRIRR